MVKWRITNTTTKEINHFEVQQEKKCAAEEASIQWSFHELITFDCISKQLARIGLQFYVFPSLLLVVSVMVNHCYDNIPLENMILLCGPFRAIIHCFYGLFRFSCALRTFLSHFYISYESHVMYPSFYVFVCVCVSVMSYVLNVDILCNIINILQ